MAAKTAIGIVPELAVDVRETRKLCHLASAAESGLSRSSRQVTIIAGDTETRLGRRLRARRIRTQLARSAFRRLRQPGNARVFGDVIFRSESVAIEGRKRTAKRR